MDTQTKTRAPAVFEVDRAESGKFFFNPDKIVGAIQTEGETIQCQMVQDGTKQNMYHLTGNTAGGDITGKVYKAEKIEHTDNGNAKPDWTGNFEIGGITKRIALWTKTSPKGTTWLSAKISDTPPAAS